jgi:hypothetical protein
MYWHQEIKQKCDGGLRQFALDFLLVPGNLYLFDVSFIFAYYVIATSVDCEQAFSLAGGIVTKQRNRLTADSTIASTLLSSWFSIPGLVDDEDVDDKKVKGKEKK